MCDPGLNYAEFQEKKEREIKMKDTDLIQPVATRQIVYNAIDSEREYQADLSQDKGICGTIPKSVGDYMVMLQGYMDKAIALWISTPGNEATLHFIRKIAAIAVKCMEQHGAPTRKETYRPGQKVGEITNHTK